MSYPVASATPPAGFQSGFQQTVSPRLCFVGGHSAAHTADFISTAVGATTELRVGELFVPALCYSTGAAQFNGTTATTDNSRLILWDNSGQIVASTAGALTANANVYQRFAWALEFQTSLTAGTAVTTPVRLLPGTYFLGQIQNGTTATPNMFEVGNFGAGMLVAVYATAGITTSLTIAPPATFTTLQAVAGGLY